MSGTMCICVVDDGYVGICSTCVVRTQNCVVFVTYVMCIRYMCCMHTEVCGEWYIHGVHVVCVVYEEVCVIVCV